MYLRDTSLKFQQQNLDLTRSVLNNIQKRDQPQFSYSRQMENPYTHKVNGQNEDLRWLL
jgi:hypothetical protein